MTEQNVVLVTGAASGIGLAVARRMAEDGWAVVMFDRDAHVHVAAQEVASTAVRENAVFPFQGDVGSESDIIDATSFATEQGLLLAAFANAGVGGSNRPLYDVDTHEFDRVMDINLKGVFLTCKYVAKQMLRTRSGSIVITSSVMWQAPVAGEAVYNASKVGVVGLMQGLALDMAPHGVRVNAVAPGSTRTEMHLADVRRRATDYGLDPDDVERADAASIPLGRIADPAEVAGVVSFLTSPDSSYITGAVLNVNGGLAVHL